jgi:hypothetical protein
MFAAWLIIAALLLVLACPLHARPPAAAQFHISPRTGAFFVQDNLVNSRLLDLEPGGAYRQIDVDRTSSTETDLGTWEQDAKGAILLHPTCDGLRFRALFSGPLNIVLDRPGTMEALPSLAAAIRRFLAQSDDEVFSRTGISEIQAALPTQDASGPAISIAPDAETFSRADLISLGRQLDDLLWSERTNTYILTPVTKEPPVLLALEDARFQAQDLPRVRQEYRVKPGESPPFYFARVDARTFARRAGRWKVLLLPAGPN